MDGGSFGSNFLPESHWSSSPEMQTLRLSLSSLGVSVSAAAVVSSSTHGNELIPTVIRYKSHGRSRRGNTDHSQLVNIYSRNKTESLSKASVIIALAVTKIAARNY